jgi:hypothetical protein
VAREGFSKPFQDQHDNQHNRWSQEKMNSRLTLTTAGAILLAMSLASTAAAETITVCLDGSCDFTDPAAAAAVAVNGDVIEIAAGTYLLEETISFYGPSVDIRGAVDRKGRPATILDGQGSVVVLSMVMLPQSNPRFENIVITNGFGEYGGGMFLRDGTPVFENCVISGNHADVQGGGMFLNGGASPTFIGCEISGNTAAHPRFGSLGQGGAAWISEGVVTLLDSEVSGNSAQSAGGGFGLSSSGEVVLNNSRICGNVAPGGPDSSQIAGAGTVTVVSGCVDESCDCVFIEPADLNGDNAVNGADLGLLLAGWGQPGPGDLNGDNTVGGADLGLMLAAWSR